MFKTKKEAKALIKEAKKNLKSNDHKVVEEAKKELAKIVEYCIEELKKKNIDRLFPKVMTKVFDTGVCAHCLGKFVSPENVVHVFNSYLQYYESKIEMYTELYNKTGAMGMKMTKNGGLGPIGNDHMESGSIEELLEQLPEELQGLLGSMGGVGMTVIKLGN